jgi:septum formation protein
VQLVLASSSPRRRELFASLGLDVEVIAPHVDETRHPDEEPDAYVLRVARDKARAVLGPGRVVVAADTAVVHRGRILGKPAHPAEARSMLASLAGDAHAVHTGVAVASIVDGDDVIHSAVEITVVRLLPLTDEEIGAYVATGEPMDKAGAYGLQGIGAVFVESVQGSPSNVIGLPVHVVARLLRSFDVDVIPDHPLQPGG